MEAPGVLQAADYTVVAAMLAASAGIGIYYKFSGGRQKSTREYLLADRNMPVIAVAFSVLATFLSAIGMLSFPAEVYLYGSQFMTMVIGILLAVPVVAYVYMPIFFEMQVTCANEYLEKRYGMGIRLAVSACLIFNMVFYMAVVMYAPALALSAVTGMSKWPAIGCVWAVCAFYSSLGGLKAVLWADVLQGSLMFISMVVVLIKSVIDAGGVQNVWDISQAGGRIQFFNLDVDPRTRLTFWNTVFGGFIMTINGHGVNQVQVQRLMAVKNIKAARKALLISFLMKTVLTIAIAALGLSAFANFYGCDPMMRSSITRAKLPDQIIPYHVMVLFKNYPGLPGLFVAGIFSGSASTMSSAVNSLAAITLEDFIKPLCFRKAVKDSRQALITKCLAMCYSFFCIVLIVIIEKIGQLLEASAVFSGTVSGPMLGIFTIGMLCNKANNKGAVAGLLCGIAFCTWMIVGKVYNEVRSPRLPLSDNFCPATNISLMDSAAGILLQADINNKSLTPLYFTVSQSTIPPVQSSESSSVFPLYEVSYMWFTAVGFLVTTTIGITVSLLTGGEKDLDPLLLSPVVRKFLTRRDVQTNREESKNLFQVSDVILSTDSSCVDKRTPR